MRIVRTIPFALAGILLLASCTSGNGGGDGTSSSSSSESSSSEAQLPETSNVTYAGVVSALEMSIYMQGTHMLTLDSGAVVLLESEILDLDAYIGATVEAFGSVQPTVESNGTLMKVTRIQVLSAASSSSSSAQFCGGIAGFACPDGQTCIDNPDDSCDPLNGGADCGGICIRGTVLEASSSSSSEAASSSASSDSSSSVSSSAAAVSSSKAAMSSSKPKASSSSSVAKSSSSSSVASTNSPEMEAQVVTMSKQNYEASLWTQQYCTSHIGFCLPVHKNWYYKSFGATTTRLWHVEFGMSDITGIGAGAIVLNLVNDTSASMGATDGQVRKQGNDVVGFKDWNGQHFEITGDARLQVAIQYMLSHIEQYLPAE